MEIVGKYPITCAALVLWLITILISDGVYLLLGVAIGTFLFEQGLARAISDQIRTWLKIDQ